MTNQIAKTVLTALNELTSDNDDLLIPESVAVESMDNMNGITTELMIAIELLNTRTNVTTLHVFSRDVAVTSTVEMMMDIHNFSLDC